MSAPHLPSSRCWGARLPRLLLLLLLLALAMVPGSADDDTAVSGLRDVPTANNTANTAANNIYDAIASDNTRPDDLSGGLLIALDFNIHVTRTQSHDDFTIPLPAPRGAPATAGKPSGTPLGDFLNTNLSLGGKENEDQSTVTVTGDAAGASSAVEKTTAVAALVELGTGTINSNSSGSGNSSHGGGVSSQHSQLTPSDTQHIHTALQGTTLTDGHQTQHGDDHDQWVPATTHPPRACACRGEKPGRAGRRARRHLSTLSPLLGPSITFARAGDGGGSWGGNGGTIFDRDATHSDHCTPPPGKWISGRLLHQLTRDPAGSISESAGAT